MSDFMERIDGLTPKQRALLLKRMTAKTKDLTGATEDEIPQRSGDGNRFVLSFSQLRQWILDKLEPGTAAYNLPFPLRLVGPLDKDALQKSLDRIIERHETLRTTFDGGEEEPVQVIHPHEPLDLPFLDLGDLGEEERQSELRRLVTEDAEKPFDLEQGPLLRLQLIRLSDDDHALLFTLHHIISDGWSRGVIFAELEALYDAYRQTKEPELEELSIQYADFAVWQRQYLAGENLEAMLSFWRQQLGDPPPVPNLPMDRPRPAVADSAGASIQMPLPEGTLAGLHELSRNEKASLFMTSMAAFKVLLYRYSGQGDLAVGTFIANRNRRQVAPLIGFFVNTLVIRSRVLGGDTFRTALQKEREVALESFAHQDLPFEKLLEELQPERNTALTPFFQTMLVLQNMRQKELSLTELEMSYLGAKHEHVDFDLTVWLREVGESLNVVFDYRTTLFDATTAERILDHYGRLLTAVSEDPDRNLGDLPLLSAEEEGQLLREWTATQAELAELCVHELFEQQALQSPDAVAVEDGADLLSYAELDAASNRLAHRLVQSGVGPEDLVAVSLTRSPNQVVSLLAILKAGGTYLPLDPDYPQERQAFMLSDSGAKRLVTTADSGLSLPEDSLEGIEVIQLDVEEASIKALPSTLPSVTVSPDNGAYVIYTSGSTGRPKGVLVPHRALANYAQDAADAYNVTATDRALQFATINFDTSAEEIYPTLIKGGTLVLRSDEMIVSVAGFLEQLGKLNISLLNLPTAYWHQICSELRSGLKLPKSLRRVIIGGEKAIVDHLVAWQEGANDEVELVNTYGPTEATIVTTRFELAGTVTGEELVAQKREIPLGRPLSNARVYVLDRHHRLAAIRAVGEIAIGGKGLARGYLGRPSLTAERFIPDPFGADGERLYLSGDLGTWRAEGELEYFGRADHQVKLRGFRVELGEIESALRLLDDVRDAVVEARRTGEDLRLVAYVVMGETSDEPSASKLKEALGDQLPSYMVPPVIVFLDALPTTPSGKLDRKALPDPISADIERKNEYVAPRTTVETLLGEIWEELLSVDHIGAEDDFFELGGHSLLATRLVARVRGTFGAEIPLIDIFDNPSLAEMARAIERLENVDSTPLPPLKRLSREEHTSFPLSLPQERIWVLNELQGDNLAYHFVFVLRLVGKVDKEVLRRVLDELVRRHEIYRTTFHQELGRPIQVVHPMPIRAAYEEIDLSHMPVDEARRRSIEIASEAGRGHFDVRKLPLVRWITMDLEGDEMMVAQVEHHFVHDGWSVAVTMAEFQTLYEAFIEGRPSPLPDLEIQFGDFCHWQQELVSGPYYETLRDYWVNKVGDAEQILDLPADFPRQRVNRFEGKLVQVSMRDDLYEELREYGIRNHTSLYINTLTAFYALLYRYTGQKSFLLGSMIANRRLKEAEALVGMIVNTLLLRGDVNATMTFKELQTQVRRTVMEAHAHQDMPFERLVGELNPVRDLSRNPLFQLMFAFHDSPVPDVEFAGIKGELRSAHNSSAKADLNVVMIPKEERRRGAERQSDDAPTDLLMNWEYNTDLFERSTIERMVRHYEILLEGFIKDPGRPILQTPMMSAAERGQLLEVSKSSAQAELREVGIHQLFEERAMASPDAIALVAGGEELTYAELDARSNRWAHHLLSLGLQREQFVGVCTDRSTDLVVALLAVLKAGGAYLPLDPDFPADRIAYMLSDTAAPFVLSLGDLAGRLPESNATKVVRLDREDVSDLPSTRPEVAVTTASLAYVLHTSGSTGRPKGVAVSHGAVVNFLTSMANEPGLGTGDVLVAVTTVSFDIAGLEIFLPLMQGARLVLADRETAMDAEHLQALMEESGVTAVQATPATWQMLFAGGWDGNPSLKVLCGGEALPAQLGRRLLESCQEVWNLYGPTETTIWSTTKELQADDMEVSAVPIGQPIQNTQTYVLDPALELTPIGVPGELWIGGAGLARGYLGRPAATAERFMPNPYSDVPGARLYRTGDRVRRLENDHLTFLGRLDHQVKVRGFRIELGEIESALDRHPAVSRTVAVTLPDTSGHLRILACYVPENGDGDAAELRDHLRAHLPEYMMPSAFMPMEAFPMTPNGKVDRVALGRQAELSPDTTPTAALSGVPPRTPLEEELKAVWETVLDRETIGVHDSFFNLGGHSLLATQILARLRQTYGLKLSLVKFFESPTLAELAALIEEQRESGAGATSTIQAEEGAADVVANAENLDDADLDALLGSMMEDR